MKKPVKVKKDLYDHAAVCKMFAALAERCNNLEKQVSTACQVANDVEALLLKANGRITALESWHKDHNEWLCSLHEDRRARFTGVSAHGEFCVIGDRSGCKYPISRTWKDTQAEAEQYAASLVRNQSTATELLVVKVVSKVGRKEPDIKVTRV
jgi:hypothetical protein